MKTLSLLLLFILGQLTITAQQPPGQSQYEMAVDLFNAEEFEDGLMILDMAIAKENVDAIIYKGDLYFKGKGVEKSYTQAFDWYKKGCALGSYNAMVKIGTIYNHTLIPDVSYADAVSYYISLFEEGQTSAAALIGQAYLDGHGVSQSNETAEDWFNKGASQNDKNCNYHLAKLKLVTSPADAIESLESLCNEDHITSCSELGELYYLGEYTEKNIETATEYIEKGIKSNDGRAHYLKAQMILEYAIDGTKKEAVQLVDKAKKLGYSVKDCDFLKLRIYGEMH